MAGDYIRMKLFAVSLQRDGAPENNLFMDSIVWNDVQFDGSGNPTTGGAYLSYDPITEEPVMVDYTGQAGASYGFNLWNYFVLFPVPIPENTGTWFENVTTAQVDNTGMTIDDELYSPYMKYDAVLDDYVINEPLNNALGPFNVGQSYGFDPLWNVEDPNTYTYVEKDGTIETLEYTHYGSPKPLDFVDAILFKENVTLQKRLLLIYNDNPTAVTNTKIRIADQNLKGAITEIYQYSDMSDGWYYEREPGYSLKHDTFNWLSALDNVKTDGGDYRPEFVKFWIGPTIDTNTTANVAEEITIDYLGPAGTKEAWAFAVLTQYVTKENGNFAGVDNDYMILATETNAY